jgi:acetolactate decarboxylase
VFVRAAIILLGFLSAESLRSFGDVRRVIREHDVGPKVALDRVLATPHAYGLGSLSGLRGEITIVDGKAWLAYPPRSASTKNAAPAPGAGKPAEAIEVVTQDANVEKAAFLVATHVAPDAWTKVALPEGLSSKDLEATLARAARAHGLEDRELAFRAVGMLETLTLAIIDGSRVPPGPGTEETLKAANVLQTIGGGARAELVGFYSRAPQSPFTHPGKHAHVHAVVPDKPATGHAQEFVLKPGATLWLAGAD